MRRLILTGYGASRPGLFTWQERKIEEEKKEKDDSEQPPAVPEG